MNKIRKNLENQSKNFIYLCEHNYIGKVDLNYQLSLNKGLRDPSAYTSIL